ncbi:MAG: type II secretion system F family protein [Nitrospirota bacterium]
MPLYEYEGVNPQGEKVTGFIDAESINKARAILKQSGIFITRALSEGKERHIWRKPSLKSISSATFQLKTLLSAGMTVIDAMNALVEQEGNRYLKRVLADVRDMVVEGKSLSSAMACYPMVFNDLYINMVAAGEASGNLESALEGLCTHMDRQEKISLKVKSALAYPLLMTVVSGFILFYLLSSVVPKVVSVFSETEKVLPLPTAILIFLSGVLSKYWYLFLGAIAGIGYVANRSLKSERGRRLKEWILDRIPYTGNMVNLLLIFRTAKAMEMLLSAGVSLLHALGVVKKITGHKGFEGILQRAIDGVKEGKSLADSLSAGVRMSSLKSQIFSAGIIGMIKTGERSGEIEMVFRKIADNSERELEMGLEGLLSIIEPVLILIMGVIVGFIVLSILLPIFEMSTIIR